MENISSIICTPVLTYLSQYHDIVKTDPYVALERHTESDYLFVNEYCLKVEFDILKGPNIFIIQFHNCDCFTISSLHERQIV